MLKIAHGLHLPDDAATQKLALIGRSGSGKSYAAGKLVEELLGPDGHRNQVVIVDPVGVWHGLRLAADGKKPGIPIPIFGGEHGDVPLEATAGALIAGLVVDKGVSLVLDTSSFTGGEMRRFVADFATELLQRKKRARSPVMVVWEEAQEVVPQHVYKDAARMVGAMERLIKIGRNFGIGTLLITQRPQAVAKDVLNQTEVLFVFQTTGPQERKVVEGWIVEHGADVTAAVDELPKLPRGTCYAWSPQWLQFFGKVAIGKKWTYDASATPTAGAAARAGKLAPVDLDAVRTAMAATIENAKANDPRELKARIAALEKQVAAKPAAAPASEPVRVEVPVLTEKDKDTLGGIHGSIDALRDLLASVNRLAEDVIGRATLLHGEIAGRARLVPAAPVRTSAHQPAPLRTRVERSAPTRNGGPPSGGGSGDITGGPRRMLEALAVRHPTPLTRGQIGMISGLKASGGTFGTYLSQLRVAGLIVDQGGAIALTDPGVAAAGDVQPASRDEVLALWAPKLTSGARRMLDALIDVGDDGLSRADLGAATDIAPSGGTFGTYLSALRTAGLIEDGGAGVRVTELLL